MHLLEQEKAKKELKEHFGLDYERIGSKRRRTSSLWLEEAQRNSAVFKAELARQQGLDRFAKERQEKKERWLQAVETLKIEFGVDYDSLPENEHRHPRVLLREKLKE